MSTQIQWRRDTAAAWAAADPVLADGEAGYETDTGVLRIGDGVSAWTLLPEFGATTGGGGGGGGGSSSGTDRALVDPTGLAWSWINQGPAAVATAPGKILLTSPMENTDSWHMRAKVAPATPYSVIIHMKATRIDVNYSGVCVGWHQTSNAQSVLVAQRGQGNIFDVGYTSPGGWGLAATYTSVQMSRLWDWIKLTDDGTNRKVWVSADGDVWVQIHTTPSGTTITPDRLVFGLESRNGTYGIGLALDSWEEF